MSARKILLALPSTDYIGGGLCGPIMFISFQIHFKWSFQHIRHTYVPIFLLHHSVSARISLKSVLSTLLRCT